MKRSVFAIIGGVLFYTVISIIADLSIRKVFGDAFSDSGLLVGTIVYATVCGVLAAYVTARLARERPLVHAMVLGSILLMMALWELTTSDQRQPLWFNFTFAVLILPSFWLGGFIRLHQMPPAAANG